MNQTNSLQILKNQLRHYGLNPSEWTMTAKNTQQLIITHRQDKNLSFVGRTNLRKPKPEWLGLTLRSI